METTGSTPNNEEQSTDRIDPVGPNIRRKTDIGWRYCSEGTNNEGKNVLICCFCLKKIAGGGINRMKLHLSNIQGHVEPCTKVPVDVKFLIESSMKENAQKAKEKKGLISMEEVREQNSPIPVASKDLCSASSKKRKASDISTYFKDGEHDATQPFCKACSLDKVTSIDHGYKAPTYHALRVTLLKDARTQVRLLVDSLREHWTEYGCTIMSDGWTDTRQRPLINFLVYYPEGISFIKSVDALDIITDADTLCNLFGEIVEIVGPENVVHMVTGNGANYKAAGRKLTERYSTIKWSLCAVHCLNLVIKDIAEMPKVKDIATLASKITVFVYNHKWTLNWLRKRDGWTEIVRPGATHFATTFIALKSLHDHKNHLQALVVCDDFKKFLEMPKGKDVKQIVLDERFWNNSLILVRVMTPLICLMRICDSDEKPAIGYVYEGMHRARIGIKKLFKGKKQLYKPYTTVIKNRWDKMLRHSIHDAAYWLNPAFQYDKKNMCQKPEIMKSFLDMVDNQNLYNKQKVVQENIIYQTRKKYFSCDIALESCKTMRPDEWWRCFAYDVPSLQKFAMRILSQTASSSGCERIWSVFERIHTKKRNRLEHQRLTDLVYVHYNLRLQNRSIIEKRSYDPVDYESIDKTEFWIVEEEQEGELNIDELENMIDEYPNVNEEPISIPFEVNGDEPVIPDEDNDDDDIEINVDDED